MDTTNPAVFRRTEVPPQLLEEVAEDPSKFEPVARAMAVIHLDQLYRKMQESTTPLGTRLDFQKMLNKMSRLELSDKAQAASGAGFSITINIPQTSTTQSAVIEATATHLPDMDDADDADDAPVEFSA